MEARSAHISTGLRYLPAIARRLHHGRDLGEPFDFPAWFEYAPADAAAFDELLAALRRTEEWTYVSREVEARLSADTGHDMAGGVSRIPPRYFLSQPPAACKAAGLSEVCTYACAPPLSKVVARSG